MFYIQLAFYLGIPSSDAIEQFMNLHGYSIKSNMLVIPNVMIQGKYFIRCRDLCRWIDAGIDYNLINEILGYQLQIKEQR